MKMLHVCSWAIITFMLTGCAADSGMVVLGDDSYMISKQGLVVSREDFIHNVNGISEDSSNKSIDVMVGRIRNKLGDKTLIESVRGVGYKLLK